LQTFNVARIDVGYYFFHVDLEPIWNTFSIVVWILHPKSGAEFEFVKIQSFRLIIFFLPQNATTRRHRRQI